MFPPTSIVAGQTRGSLLLLLPLQLLSETYARRIALIHCANRAIEHFRWSVSHHATQGVAEQVSLAASLSLSSVACDDGADSRRQDSHADL